MKFNSLMALVCAASFATVACSKNESKKQDAVGTPASEVTIEEKVEVIPEGLYKDEPVVLTSDFKGKNVSLAFDGDVTFAGQMQLSGQDAQAFYAAMDVAPEEIAVDVSSQGWRKVGNRWTCMKTVDSDQAESFECSMDFDYATGKSVEKWKPNVGNKFMTMFGSNGQDVTALYEGESLILLPVKGKDHFGTVNVTGDDARHLWYVMKIDEIRAPLEFASLDIRQKTSREITCWKTPVGELVSFNCRVLVDWGWGQVRRVSRKDAGL